MSANTDWQEGRQHLFRDEGEERTWMRHCNVCGLAVDEVVCEDEPELDFLCDECAEYDEEQ